MFSGDTFAAKSQCSSRNGFQNAESFLKTCTVHTQTCSCYDDLDVCEFQVKMIIESFLQLSHGSLLEGCEWRRGKQR